MATDSVMSSQPGRAVAASAARDAPTGTAVTVRYWAAARAATGAEQESCRAGSVAEVLQEACARHPRLLPVATVASILLDGRTVERGAQVPAGSTLEVLPPFAGG